MEKRLYQKFNVFRTDGSSKHQDCHYFVLDWEHDPYTLCAMQAYANACQEQYPELAMDIQSLINYYSQK